MKASRVTGVETGNRHKELGRMNEGRSWVPEYLVLVVHTEESASIKYGAIVNGKGTIV